MTHQFLFSDLWEGDDWRGPSYVILDSKGLLLEIRSTPRSDLPIEKVDGFVLPAIPNTHSHAFQYAMAGMSQHIKDNSEDDFWSWREAMYSLANSISSEQMQVIATKLYANMVTKGYGKVVEFHYLHNEPNGSRPKDVAAYGHVLMQAAQQAGIDLLLLPIYYNQGGFGRGLSSQQKRFESSSLTAYRELLQATREAAEKFPRAEVGYGLHSLRAATEQDACELIGSEPGPCHLHIAEQPREVDECLALRKLRPVEWLLKNCPVNSNTHLVHATHITSSEIEGIVNSGASVVICPTTEADLGDGFFTLEHYLKAGGTWSIGSDSHTTVNPFEELKWLDYGVRLRLGKRNPLTRPNQDTGQMLYRAAISGGRQACGLSSSSSFEIGKLFDAIVLNAKNPLLISEASRLSSLIFSFEESFILGRLKGHHWLVQDGIHQNHKDIDESWFQVCRSLRA